MQAAESIACLDGLLGDEDGVAVLRAADVDRRVAAGLDDPVERAAIDDQILDQREGLGPPRLERDACRRP